MCQGGMVEVSCLSCFFTAFFSLARGDSRRDACVLVLEERALAVLFNTPPSLSRDEEPRIVFTNVSYVLGIEHVLLATEV